MDKRYEFFKIYWFGGIIIALTSAVYEFLNKRVYGAGVSGALGLVGTMLFIHASEKVKLLKNNSKK